MIKQIYHKLKRSYNKLGCDELMSAANTGVGVAINKLDSNKCKNILSYIANKGYFCAIDQIRKDWHSRQFLEKGIHSPFSEFVFSNTVTDDTENISNVPTRIDNTEHGIFDKLIESLPEWEQNILKASYVHDIKRKDIAKNFMSYAGTTYKNTGKLYIKEAYLSCIFKKILKKLKKRLPKNKRNIYD